MVIKRRRIYAVYLLLGVSLTGCRPAASNPAADQPSFGESLEQSLSQSAGEQDARNRAKQRQKELQSRQQALQQERLKSYGGGAVDQNQ